MHNQALDHKPFAVKTFDKFTLVIMGLLVAFGSLMIYSSTSVVTPLLAKKQISEFYYFKRHMFTLLLGVLAMLAVYRIKPSQLQRMAVPVLVFSFVLLLCVFVPHIGVTAGGARRWIRLWPTTFQPSELVKLAMVLYLSCYLSRPEYNPERLWSFVKPLLIMLLFQAVFLKQPDFGATMSLAILTIALLFISGVKMRYLGGIALLGVPVVYKLAMEPYRLRRITSFLDPWKDPQASGFQLIQSFIALGSGGLTGLGLGESKQKLSFLPASHTDFIFCLVGEELGLIGASLVIALFLLLFLRGLAIANRSRDSFVFYLSYGLILMISLQAIINFSVVTGLVPTKGLPLPFMSFGGSALLVNMIAIAILLRISKCEEDAAGDRDHAAQVRKLARRNIYHRRGYRR